MFQYKDAANRTQTLNAGQPPIPRKVTEYRVEYYKWDAWEGDDWKNVDGILRSNLDDRHPCFICGSEGGTACGPNDNDCVTYFRTQISQPGEAKIEIRSTPNMGRGVYAKVDIPEDELLGEYLGELIPIDGYYGHDSAYVFEFDSFVSCDARQFGNWTRFMNHHCSENVKPLTFIYGTRSVIAFKTTRPIAAGEQLCTWYGRGYFTGGGTVCKCDNEVGDHLPPAMPAPAAPAAPAGPSTAAPAAGSAGNSTTTALGGVTSAAGPVKKTPMASPGVNIQIDTPVTLRSLRVKNKVSKGHSTKGLKVGKNKRRSRLGRMASTYSLKPVRSIQEITMPLGQSFQFCQTLS